MNIRDFLLSTLSLAVVAGISASSARGETDQIQRQSIAAIAPTLEVDQSDSLANLAADLAKTAAKLQELQNAQQSLSQQHSIQAGQSNQPFSDVESARQFNSPSRIKETTVRWLNSNASPSYQNIPGNENTQHVESPAVISVASNASQQNNASPTVSRDQPLRRLPAAEEAGSNSQIVQTLANESSDEIFYIVKALQEEIEPESVTELADENYSDAESSSDLPNPVYVSDSCCGPTCDDISFQPSRPPRRRTIVMGTEAVFLSPDLNGVGSSYVFDDFTAPTSHYEFGPGAVNSPNTDLDDFYIAPRLWLGVQGECWGVVGRYFHLRAGEQGYDSFQRASRDSSFVTTSPLDQGYDVNSLFEAYYTDLELTRNFYLNGSKNQFSFGARYALIENNESVFANVETEEGVLRGHARSNRQARGTGLTFGLNGRKPLFCNSCAHWFYSVRSSVLWGYSRNATETWSESVLLNQASADLAFSDDGAYNVADADLYIGEVQLGIEWNFAMRCLPAKSFFRMAFEYQYWDSSRGQASAGSSAGFGNPNNPDVEGVASASAPGIRAELIGFLVGTGFTW